jgi:hypothetical protein
VNGYVFFLAGSFFIKKNNNKVKIGIKDKKLQAIR